MPLSDDRYQTALEAAGIGIWDKDFATGVIYFSGGSLELFGLAPGTVLAPDLVLSRVHPDDRASVEKNREQALDPAIRSPFLQEFRIRAGEEGAPFRWVRSRGQAYFDEAGHPYRFTGTLQDITQEMEERARTRKLQALMDNSIELMSVLENDGRNSYLNRAGMAMLGFRDFDQVLQTPISDLHQPEDIAFVQREVLPSVLATGRWSGRMNVRHLQTGEVFPVYNNTVRIDDPHTGQQVAIGAVMRDLRPELEGVRALEESEANFRSLVMQAPVGICILEGAELRFIIANDTYLQQARKSREVLIGRTLADALPEAEEQGFGNLLRTILRTGEAFYGKEYEVRLEGSGQTETAWFDFTYQPLRQGDGSIARIMSLAIDVTDKVLARKRLQENEEALQRGVAERTAELERKNRELEEFTYVSSHDLQEPLRKILLFSEAIRERDYEALSPYSRERFDKICASARRMGDSLRDLLNYAAQGTEEALLPVDLNAVVREVLSDLDQLIEERGAEVSVDPLPVVPGVRPRMQQLFYNLLHNGLKFVRPGVPPRISVRCQFVADAGQPLYRIEVEDNGIGFPQDKAERIFGLFQRLHGRQEYAGTGIGLSLCLRIVSQLGGRIYARGTEGAGALFTLEVPAGDRLEK